SVSGPLLFALFLPAVNQSKMPISPCYLFPNPQGSKTRAGTCGTFPARRRVFEPAGFGILMLTVVDDAGHLSTQVFPRYDPIYETVLEKELAGLETLGQLQTDGIPDGAFASEADEGARLGQCNVSLEGEARRHSSHGGIGEDGHVQ